MTKISILEAYSMIYEYIHNILLNEKKAIYWPVRMMVAGAKWLVYDGCLLFCL